jgi:hypothetical protein
MKGVEHVATSTGFVAYGIYTKIYASDNWHTICFVVHWLFSLY